MWYVLCNSEVINVFSLSSSICDILSNMSNPAPLILATRSFRQNTFYRKYRVLLPRSRQASPSNFKGRASPSCAPAAST